MLEKLERDLGKKRPPPSFLLCGEEQTLVDRAVALLTERLLDKAGADFGLTRFDGKGTSAAEIDAAARTASLFGGSRLVLVRDANELSQGELKKLIPLLERPPDTATIVLTVRGAGPGTRDMKLQKIARTAKTLAAAVREGGGVVHEFAHPKPREVPALVEAALAERGLSADRDGLYALVDAVGADLGALLQAAEKLSLFLGGAGLVTQAAVAAVVIDTRSESIFDLLDAVAEGKLLRALSGVRRLLRDGEEPLVILAQLARHFRLLAQVQALSERGEDRDAIRSTLGAHPFVIQKAQDQCWSFTPESLGRALRRLADTDRMLKGGAIPARVELERLLFSLAELQSGAPKSRAARSAGRRPPTLG